MSRPDTSPKETEHHNAHNTADDRNPKEATEATIKANKAVATELELGDPRDGDNASANLMYRVEPLIIPPDSEVPIWDLTKYDFLRGEKEGTGK